MGVNTRLISSRINIKMQRVSHMNHPMPNTSHVNKYQALSFDFLSAAWIGWIMWVQTNGFGAVLVKQGEQVRGSVPTIISLNLTRDKATWCIPQHFCILLSMTPCHTHHGGKGFSQFTCVFKNWTKNSQTVKEYGVYVNPLTLHVYIFTWERGGGPRLLHCSAVIYLFCSWQNKRQAEL